MNISNWINADHSITVLQKYGYFAIFLDDEFYCSCDNWHEVIIEIENAKKEIQENVE